MTVLIIGASGGIGAALASAASERGAQVRRLSRSADGLDVTDEASVAAHLGALEGEFEAVIVAAWALEIGAHGPEKSLRARCPLMRWLRNSHSMRSARRCS